MKPFNLEEAKAGKPVVTGCNRPVRILCFDRNHAKFPIVALVPMYSDGVDVVSFYTKDGRHQNESSFEKNAQNLYMKKEKKTGWVNIYKSNPTHTTMAESSCIYESKSIAENAAVKSKNYLGAFKVEWEE